VEIEESLEASAHRELGEETGISDVTLEQLCAKGDVNRDPRERVVTVAYYALVNLSDHPVRPATDARRVAWFALDQTPPLAFDHDQILVLARDRLQDKVRRQPIGLELLPERFSFRQFQRVYELVLARKLDSRSFRRKIRKTGLLVDLSITETDAAPRGRRKYRFDKQKYQQYQKRGFHLEL
jgi:8-oxo-dGTP diphosphatase